MPSYYNEVEGNLHAGDIAKSSDINHIQIHIKDALQNLLDDHHENTAYILGGDENAFLITPAPMFLGRYIDTYSLPEEQYYQKLPIRTYDYRQPIAKTKTSCYSVICKLGNKSSYPVTVWFELQDISGLPLRRSSVTVPKGTESAEFEVVFDFDKYPTAPGLDHSTLAAFDGKHIPPRGEEESFDEGVDHTDEESINNSSIGVSQLYFVVKALNINEFDVAENGDEYIGIKEDDFYIIADKQGVYGYSNNNSFVEQDGGSGFQPTQYSLYFKDVYATDPTYLCTGGEAIINGEKVMCMDNHVTVAGGHEYGNVLSLIYMDTEGHLHSANSQASNSTSTDMNDYTFDLDAIPPIKLLIAKILTYVDSSKPPLIIQNDDEQVSDPAQRTRLRSHHERIRRLEKQMNYVNDVAIPPRIKYTVTGEDWIDKDKDGNLTDSSLYVTGAHDGDGNSDYITTVDANGNFVVKTTKNDITNVPVTLKSDVSIVSGITGDRQVTTDDAKEYDKDISESKTKSSLSKYKESDTTKLNRVSEMTNLTLNTKNGVLTLRQKEEGITKTVGLTEKEAKETKFNPWDDSAENRPANSNIKPNERKYTVTKGKDGKNDWASEFPGMTFFAKTSYKLTGLTIPIHKFENCSGIRFYIWKRQGPNNKTNTVWLEKLIYTSQIFSLKNAKTKGKYQYIDEGFTMKFGSEGLTLEKGQYVIVALPIPKSGEGSCFVETYKPENSKDFCIRYYGAANASHFLLKTRYQEIWYNSVTAFGKKTEYEKKGSFISGTVTYTTGDPITSVKANIGTLDVPKGCKFTLYGNVGSGWQKLNTDGSTTTMNTSGMSFKWKAVFEGNKEDTPTLKYDSKKKYALNFTLIKKFVNTGSNNGLEYETNMSLTSKPFDGNSILRQYIGDPYFDLDNDRFSNYEFARIWGEKESNQKLLIDISASDVDKTFSNKSIPVYSLHYCDLTLDDFSNTSVDYSNYDNQLEVDENNLRLKLDTENSYNDNDIYLFGVDKFVGQSNDIMTFEHTETGTNDQGESETTTVADKIIRFSNTTQSTKNQTLLKANFQEPIDLSKYTGIKVGFKVTGAANVSMRGLAIYFSSAEETETPSNFRNDPEDMEVLSDVDVTLESFNTTDNDLVSKYENKILKIYGDPSNDLQASQPTYYRYVRTYDSTSDKIVYVREQIHDIKSYTIYKLPELQADTNTVYKTFEIDQNNPNLQYVREIGIIALMEEREVDSSDNSWFVAPASDLTIELVEFRSIERDYYPIYNPSNNTVFTTANSQFTGVAANSRYRVFGKGKISLKNANTYKGASQATEAITNTSPITTQITIQPQNISQSGEKICYFNNKIATKNYKHIGFQIASDCYIPKNALKLNLCADNAGANVIESVNIPTLNYIYYPNTNGKTIPLSQVFKKIDTLDTTIKSISITATDKFYSYMKGMFYDKTNKNWDKKPMINIFIGKVVLYKAETIPIFHKKMRFKFYNTDKDGLTTKNTITEEDIQIRKIGAVLDYK